MHLLTRYPAEVPVRISAQEPPLVRVAGEGRLEVPPDTALIFLGFAARAEQAAAAYQQTAAVLNRVVRELLEMGIPQDQLQTTQVSLQPVYERERLVGYEGSATLQVTLRDLSAVGATIDRAVAAGANTVRGVSFEVRDPTTYEANALVLAVQDAYRKAALLSRSLGVGLGPVWRVETEPAPGPIVPVFARAAAAEAIPILPGTLTLTRRVQLEYVIQYP